MVTMRIKKMVLAMVRVRGVNEINDDFIMLMAMMMLVMTMMK